MGTDFFQPGEDPGMFLLRPVPPDTYHGGEFLTFMIRGHSAPPTERKIGV